MNLFDNNNKEKTLEELKELYEKEQTGCINVTINVDNAMTNYLLQHPIVDFETLKKTIHQQIDEICNTEYLYGFSYNIETRWDDVPHVNYSISKYVVPKQLEKRIFKNDN